MKKSLVALATLIILSGCVLVGKTKWVEAQDQIDRLTLENEVLHERLSQLEVSVVDLDERVDALEPPQVKMLSPLDVCRGEKDMESLVRCVAKMKGFRESTAVRVVRCESGFNPNARGDWSRRKRRYLAWGLWQYHPHEHPELADNVWGFTAMECALDPICSSDHAMDAIARGMGPRWWTCY